jgi:membrane protein DedA with SNARE-associated domain
MRATWSRRHRVALGALLLVALLLVVLVLQSVLTGVEVVDVDISLGILRDLAQRFTGEHLTRLLATYGYWTVLALVAVESMGIPLPGETMLLVAAIYAGTTHRLALPLLIAAAAAGAILGDNAGFVVGHEGGYRLLRRYGPVLGLNERKLKLGQYLFWRHGGKVVFFGRFVAVLRMWAAFLAGTTHMPWRRFLLYNAAGGITWATLYGLGGYVLGDSIHTLGRPLGIATVVLALLGMICGALILRRNERRLEDEAERALPGPFGTYPPDVRAVPASTHTADGPHRTAATPDVHG